MSDIVVIKKEIESTKDAFTGLATGSVNHQKESEFAMQLLSANTFLLSTAMKNKESIRSAIMNIALIGLSLNPASKLAYLVPRGGKVCLDISYIGLVKLATDTGSILWVQANVVRHKDEFVLNGAGKEPTHKYNPFATDRGDIIGAYCIAKTGTGEFLTEVMSLNELIDIRDRTEAYKAYAAKKTQSCPWISDETEMMKKTVVKRAYKYWPKSERLERAINVINEHEGIDFEKEKRIVDVTPASLELIEVVDGLLAGIENGEKRLIKHINDKDKVTYESIEELTEEQANYAISFLEQNKKKKNG
jgi:recombination protein RecT